MIAAITMVYRDYWALAQWYTHYSRHIGPSNLYIVAHGSDPKIAEICPKASIITVPRNDLSRFDGRRGEMLNAFQNGLLASYDWVIRTDVDELMCLDPAHYKTFGALFSQHKTPKALFSLGIEIFEDIKDSPLSDDGFVLKTRKSARFSGHYSKAWAVRERVDLVRHGVKTLSRRMANFEFTLPKGVYLLHLKYANSKALEISDNHRALVANGSEKGLPGNAWRDAKTKSDKMLRTSRACPHQPWEDAMAEAYNALAKDPLRGGEKNIVRARSIRFETRTSLPEWFQTY